MSNNSNRKQIAQGGLEYLITYGWALVMIATIIGVLAMTSTGVNKDVCPNFRGSFMTLTCEKIYADGDKLELILRNSTGQKITLNPFTDICFDGKCGYVIVYKGGVKYDMQKIVILPGETVRIEALGTALANTTTITYEEAGTGMVRTIASGLSTSAPRNVEIKNNALDDDGDGLVDCEDPDTADPVTGKRICTYIFAATSMPNINLTINKTPFKDPIGNNPLCSTGTGDNYYDNYDNKYGYNSKLIFGNIPSKFYCCTGNNATRYHVEESVISIFVGSLPKNTSVIKLKYDLPYEGTGTSSYRVLLGRITYPIGTFDNGTISGQDRTPKLGWNTFTSKFDDTLEARWIDNSQVNGRVGADVYVCARGSGGNVVISQAKFKLTISYLDNTGTCVPC